MSQLPPPYDLAALLSPTEIVPDQESRRLHFAHQQAASFLQTNRNGLSQPNLAFAPNGQVPPVSDNSWTSPPFAQQPGTLHFSPPYAPTLYNNQTVLTSINTPQNAMASSVPFAPPYSSLVSSHRNPSMPFSDGREEGELSDGDLTVSRANADDGRPNETQYSPNQSHRGYQSMYGAGSSWRPGPDRPRSRADSRTPPNRRPPSRRQESFTAPSPRSARSGYDSYRPSEKAVKSPSNSQSNVTTLRKSSPDKRPSTANDAGQSPVSPLTSNGISNEYLVEQKERAKRSLLQFYRNNIGYDDLLKEGLDASHLASIYQEIGIPTAHQEDTTRISSANSDSEAYDPAAPALAIRNTSKPNAGSSSRKYSTSKSFNEGVPRLETSTAAPPPPAAKQTAPLTSSESPTMAVGNAETINHSTKQQSSAVTRDNYIARLKAAKIKPKTHTELQSPGSTTAIPSVQNESSTEPTSKVAEAGSTTKTTAEKGAENSTESKPDLEHLPSETATSPTFQDKVSAGPQSVPDPAVALTASVNTEEKRQAELARLKRSALESIKLKRVKSDMRVTNAPEGVAISTSTTPDPKLKADVPLSEGTKTMELTRQSSASEAGGASNVSPAPTTPFGRIPGLSVAPASAISKPSFLEGRFSDNKANGAAQRKRPVAADFAFDDAEPPNKRPFGEVRSGDENEGIVIEASDDETVSTGRDATPALANSDAKARKQTSGASSALKESVRYAPVDSLLQEVLTSTGEREISTGPASTTDNDDKPDLKRREREIQHMKQRIADMERKRRAKAYSSRTPTPSAVQHDASQVLSSADDVSHIVSGRTRGSAPTSTHKYAQNMSRTESGLDPAPDSRLSAQPGSDGPEWLQKRREEIRQGIPALDAEFANKSTQMELLKEQMRKLEESMRKDTEDKQRLVEELEALGVDTEGMAHSTMQDVKNNIIAQQQAEQRTANQSPEAGDSSEDLYEHSLSSDVEPLASAHDNGVAQDEADYEGSASSMSMSSEEEDMSALNAGVSAGQRQPQAEHYVDLNTHSKAERDFLSEGSDMSESPPYPELASNDDKADINYKARYPAQSESLSSNGNERTPPSAAQLVERRVEESHGDHSIQEHEMAEAAALEPRAIPASFDGFERHDELEPTSHALADSGKASLNPPFSPVLPTSDALHVQEVETLKSESPDQPEQPTTERGSSRISEDDLDDLYGSDAVDPHPELPTAQQQEIDMSDGYDLDSTESETVARQQDGGEQDMDLSEESDYEPPDSTLDDTAMLNSQVESESEEEGEYEPPEASVSLRGGDNDDTFQSTPAAVSNANSLPLSPEEGELSDTLLEDVGREAESDEELEEPTDHNSRSDPYLTHDDRFTPYESSLRRFNAYRNHTEFPDNVPGGYRSLTYSNNIDKALEVCPSEIRDGTCSDPQCHYQHLQSMGITDESLLARLGNANPGRDEDERRLWAHSLNEKLLELREQEVLDVESIASEITALRRRFLDSVSRESIFDFMS